MRAPAPLISTLRQCDGVPEICVTPASPSRMQEMRRSLRRRREGSASRGRRARAGRSAGRHSGGCRRTSPSCVAGGALGIAPVRVARVWTTSLGPGGAGGRQHPFRRATPRAARPRRASGSGSARATANATAIGGDASRHGRSRRPRRRARRLAQMLAAASRAGTARCGAQSRRVRSARRRCSAASPAIRITERPASLSRPSPRLVALDSSSSQRSLARRKRAAGTGPACIKSASVNDSGCDMFVERDQLADRVGKRPPSEAVNGSVPVKSSRRATRIAKHSELRPNSISGRSSESGASVFFCSVATC